MIEKLLLDWYSLNWVNDTKYSYTYDVNNNMIEELRQDWDGSNWVNTYRDTYSYRYLPTDVSEFTSEVNAYGLSNNYPNPFNPSTVISYQLPVSGDVTLKVFDVLGNEIATLLDEYKPAGNYEIEFNVAQISRPEIASGIYFYQLKAGDFIETKKMILLK